MKNKHFLHIIIVCLCSLFLYSTRLHPTSDVVSTLFTVISIMFSVGAGLMETIDLSRVKDEGMYTSIHKNIDSIFQKFYVFFIISVPCYFVCMYCLKRTADWRAFGFNVKDMLVDCTFSFLVSIVVYFTVNFKELHKLKSDIAVRLRGAS